MKILHALLFAFLINLGLSAQSDLTHILNKMTQINCYMGPAVYESGEKPEQYSLYEVLRNTATKDQLISLLSHKNGVIRAYSLQALVARNEEMDWDAIALASFSDTEKVETQFGCLGGKESVGDIFLDLLVQKISPQTKKEIQKYGFIGPGLPPRFFPFLPIIIFLAAISVIPGAFLLAPELRKA